MLFNQAKGGFQTDVLFENSYVRDRTLAQEIYWYLYFKRPFYVAIDIIFTMCLVSNLITLIFYNVSLSAVVFVLVPLFYGVQFISYRRAVGIMLKRDNEIHRDMPITVQTVVTDKFIRNTASTGSVYEIEFSKIVRGYQTKNLILLRSKANLIYIFRMDTFTRGTVGEFISFLYQKGIQIK